MSMIEIGIALIEPVITLWDKISSSKKDPCLAISLDIPNCVFSNNPEGFADQQPHSGPLTTDEVIWVRNINWTIKMMIKNNSIAHAYNIKWEGTSQRGVKIPQLPQLFSLGPNEGKEFDLHVESFDEMSTDEMRHKLRCGVMPYFLDYIQLMLSFNKESGRKIWLGHVTSKHGWCLNVQTKMKTNCMRKIKRYTQNQK